MFCLQGLLHKCPHCWIVFLGTAIDSALLVSQVFNGVQPPRLRPSSKLDLDQVCKGHRGNRDLHKVDGGRELKVDRR